MPWALTEERYSRPLTKKCTEILLKLLEENGISVTSDLVIGEENKLE